MRQITRCVLPAIALLALSAAAPTRLVTASGSSAPEVVQGTACPESALKAAASEWNGWGAGRANLRFQSSPGLTGSQVPRLGLKWAFGFPGDKIAFAQPALVGGRVFVGSAGGFVYSLDANTGCTYWSFRAEAGVRTAISVSDASAGGKRLVFFGDRATTVYALDAAAGTKVWSTKIGNFPAATITGAPLLAQGRLFVPLASLEEAFATDAKYECCRFRGSVVALNPETGQQIWKTYTISDVARPTGHTPSGVQKWGPSGAGVWSAPTYDEKLDLLYVGTGDSYSEPATATSDSVLALNAKTGATQWIRQLTAGDAFTVGCLRIPKVNCPDTAGPDFDIGSSPILLPLSANRRVLVVGQKSGIVYGLDPDEKGLELWHTRVGEGGHLGGVQWGSASDGTSMYVATSDLHTLFNGDKAHRSFDPTRGGGLHALNVENGQVIWEAKPQNVCQQRTDCSPAQSAAVSAMNGVVFSGALDGHLRAYDTRNGSVLWDFDTRRSFTTVNKVEALGGSIDAAGAVIAGGMVFATSGYPAFGGAPGNVLLAFSVDGK